MASLIDKHVVIGYEVKGDLQWDQAEFQQCAACEELLVMKKHKDAYVQVFRTPMYMAANEMIQRWKDNSGSLKRRIVVIPFKYHVPPQQLNPNLMDDLMKEFSLWIQKINKAYREAVLEFGCKDLWADGVLPDELKQANEQTMQVLFTLWITPFRVYILCNIFWQIHPSYMAKITK